MQLVMPILPCFPSDTSLNMTRSHLTVSLEILATHPLMIMTGLTPKVPEFTDDSESSSIPIHIRYDIDSDIDQSRFSDTPSASSLLEEWNYEYWPAHQNEPAVETPTNTTQSAPYQYSSTDNPMTSYRQRDWSINSLHRVLHSDAAPTLRDVCVWFIRRWALRADVYFDRYLALHANDCTVSIADGLVIMTTLSNWLFQNCMRFYLSHPASMGWFVGRQVTSTWDHYQHFLNSVLRRLTTIAATCIRDVFHRRPVHSYHNNWYYRRD